jgi:hypothetical protein
MNRLGELGNQRLLAGRPLSSSYAPYPIALIKFNPSFRFFLLLRHQLFLFVHYNLNIRYNSLSTQPKPQLSYPCFAKKDMAVDGPIPSIVGALMCQKDSYLRTLKTSVVSCVEYTPPKVEIKKGKKQKDIAPTTENGTSGSEQIFLIELADSVLFPEGMSFRYALTCVVVRLTTMIQVEVSQQIMAP